MHFVSSLYDLPLKNRFQSVLFRFQAMSLTAERIKQSEYAFFLQGSKVLWSLWYQNGVCATLLSKVIFWPYIEMGVARRASSGVRISENEACKRICRPITWLGPWLPGMSPKYCIIYILEMLGTFCFNSALFRRPESELLYTLVWFVLWYILYIIYIVCI